MSGRGIVFGVSEALSRNDGIHPERERRWGWIGAIVGSGFGVGSAIVAVAFDGASLFESGPYPEIFTRSELLTIDLFLLAALTVGGGFSTAALVYSRRSPYPRSDAFGAALVGALLTTLAGFILFVRLFALVSAS